MRSKRRRDGSLYHSTAPDGVGSGSTIVERSKTGVVVVRYVYLIDSRTFIRNSGGGFDSANRQNKIKSNDKLERSLTN